MHHAFYLLMVLLFACGGSNSTSSRKAVESKPEDSAALEQYRAQPDAPAQVTVEQLNAILVDGHQALLIDVRTSGEAANGKIRKSALHFDILEEDFADKVSGLDKNKTYYLYCMKGGRSSRAQTVMTDLGFSQVINVEGGLSAWQDAGYALEY